MPDISEILHNKINKIFGLWKEKVRKSQKIPSSQNLSETALENSISDLLDSMVSALSKYTESHEPDFNAVAVASLEHGKHRASQGFNAEEITREYSLLRQTIFEVIEADLLQLSSQEFNRTFRIIDTIIDEASSQCFSRFVEEKTKRVESIQEQLLATNQELNHLLELSKESFSHLAHEIKTPLTSIMGYSQMLFRQYKSKKKLDEDFNIEHLDRVLRASRKLLQLVNSSLEFSRQEAGKLTLDLQPINVTEVVYKTMEMVEIVADTKGLEVKIDCDQAPEPETVITDSLRLEQIITNLLSNAVRYTDQGLIEVKCQQLSDQEWAFIVADTGIGIAPEDQARIFEPFSSAFLNERREDSTGLGLTIVAKLVKFLHGKISVVSAVGQGTTFTITFPLQISEINHNYLFLDPKSN